MSKTESWKTWIGLIAGLILFGLFAALWPSISAGLNLGFGGGPSTKLPAESHPIVVELPPVIQPPGLEIADMVSIPAPAFPVNLPEIEINGVIEIGEQTIIFVQPIFAVLFVAFNVIGAVLTFGLILGLIYVLLSRWVTRTKEKDTYQDHVTALDQKEKEKIKAMNNGRDVDAPSATMPRWSAISTALIICLFVFFGGMVLTSTFFPTRLVEINDEILRPAFLIVGIPLLITVTILVFAPRLGRAFLALLGMLFASLVVIAVLDIAGVDLSLPSAVSVIGLVQIITLVVLAYFWRTPAGTVEGKAEAVKEDDETGGIPYDGIAVLFTGLFVVGLGLGITLLVNSEYYELITQSFEQARSFLGF